MHPIALALLEKMRLPREGLRSKSWDELAKPGAPHLDFVFTVCDNAAGEVCPYWPGQPMTAHWGVEDPAAVEGSDMDKWVAFRTAFSLSGAHFNPAVSLIQVMRGELAARDALPYAAAQIVGCCAGALLAHAMFELPLVQFSTRVAPALHSGSPNSSRRADSSSSSSALRMRPSRRGVSLRGSERRTGSRLRLRLRIRPLRSRAH